MSSARWATAWTLDRPARCVRSSRTVTRPLPPAANAGQYAATGSSTDSRPRSTRRCTTVEATPLVVEKLIARVWGVQPRSPRRSAAPPARSTTVCPCCRTTSAPPPMPSATRRSNASATGPNGGLIWPLAAGLRAGGPGVARLSAPLLTAETLCSRYAARPRHPGLSPAGGGDIRPPERAREPRTAVRGEDQAAHRRQRRDAQRHRLVASAPGRPAPELRGDHRGGRPERADPLPDHSGRDPEGP